MLASQGGYVDMASHLIQEGADINGVSKHGYTLLMFASVNGHSEMVEFLLKNGADPNQLDVDQRSAMFLAAVQGQWHIIKLLLGHGALISPKTIAAEDKIPYLIGPMYEIGGEFYLEHNHREKAMELLELAEQTFMGMSEEYSSRATGKAIQRHLRDFAMMLADSWLCPDRRYSNARMDRVIVSLEANRMMLLVAPTAFTKFKTANSISVRIMSGIQILT